MKFQAQEVHMCALRDELARVKLPAMLPTVPLLASLLTPPLLLFP